MDLESSRSKQRAAQQQAQTQPDGVARIGDRDPLTGRYTVQSPDGGIVANGIKTYTAASKPGDIVVLFPRPDGSIALDSEKGSPTIVPDVFNKPVEEKKKAKVWILYFFGGRLWVGGHQSEPEEVGSVYLGGPSPILESAGGPGLILTIGNNSNLHVWGDASGWVATYQTFPPNFDFTSETTFHAVTSTTRKKYLTSFGFNQTGGTTGSNVGSINRNERSFPLGAGFVSYRSNRDISEVIPETIFDEAVSQTYSSVQQVSIGYIENAVPTVNQFSSSTSWATKYNSSIITSEAISYSGTIPIPNSNSQITLPAPYYGLFSCPEQSESGSGPYFKNSAIVYPALSAQIIHSYPILCDRGATYYIQESVTISGTASIQKVYELRSTGSPVAIAINSTEPRFFGIRWDIRASDSVGGVWPESTPTNRFKFVTYSDPAYYYPAYGLNSTSHGHGVLPVGHFNKINNNVLPIDEYQFYPYFVTFSGGQVVTISAAEINKAKIGSAYLQRRSVSANGVFTDLGPTFCHPIPSTAIVYHWSTTA